MCNGRCCYVLHSLQVVLYSFARLAVLIGLMSAIGRTNLRVLGSATDLT